MQVGKLIVPLIEVIGVSKTEFLKKNKQKYIFKNYI